MTLKYFSELDISQVRATSVVPLENGFGTLVKLAMGDSNEPIRIQGPVMRVAWDTTISDKFGQPQSVLPLCLKTEDGFAEWLTALRSHIKQMCVNNSLEWFGKALSGLQVDEYMSELVRPAKDSRYSDLFTPKIPIRENPDTKCWEMTIKTFTADKTLYTGNPADMLLKNSRVAAELVIPHLFFGRGTKSISLKVEAVSALVDPAKQAEDFQFNMYAQPELQAMEAAAQGIKRNADELTDVYPVGVKGEEGDESEHKKGRLEYDNGSDSDV
jgi:hypothetical protein